VCPSKPASLHRKVRCGLVCESGALLSKLAHSLQSMKAVVTMHVSKQAVRTEDELVVVVTLHSIKHGGRA